MVSAIPFHKRPERFWAKEATADKTPSRQADLDGDGSTAGIFAIYVHVFSRHGEQEARRLARSGFSGRREAAEFLDALIAGKPATEAGYNSEQDYWWTCKRGFRAGYTIAPADERSPIAQGVSVVSQEQEQRGFVSTADLNRDGHLDLAVTKRDSET
jgi:hypothetical protein